MPREESRSRIIEDGTTGDNLKINSDGSINTVPQLNPEAPANTTQVIQETFGDVASTAGVDLAYTIPNGETLTIQLFGAGAEQTTAGSVVELFYDPNGDLSVLTRVSTLFVNGTSDNTPVNQEFIGNGTRRIVMRRRGYDGSAREIFGQWIGYRA